MNFKSPQHEASKLLDLSPQARSGIVRGLQLIQDTFDLDEKQKQVLDECISIVSGVAKYRNQDEKLEETKEVERPEEVKEADNMKPEEEDDYNKKENELPRRTNPAKPTTKYVDPRRFLK